MNRLRIVIGLGVSILLVPVVAVCAQGRDPASVVQAFEAALRASNADGAAALFTDDAVITTQTATYTGKAQIRPYLQGLVAQHFHFTRVGSRQVTGAHERHTSRVAYDGLKQLGLTTLTATSDVVVQGGKISAFRVAFTPASLQRLQAAQAAHQPPAATPVMPATGGDRTPLAAVVLLLAGLGVGLLGTGFAVRRQGSSHRLKCPAPPLVVSAVLLVARLR